MDISEKFEFLSPLDALDDLWPLYEGILEQHCIDGVRPNMMNTKEIDVSPDIMIEQQHIETLDKGFKKMKKISNTSSSSMKRREIIRRNSAMIIESKGICRMLDGDGEEGQSSSVAKKMDHNARERIRRMKVNASYLALRALLPDSRTWSAPSIVDKAIKYIPELENEIEELANKKEQVQSAAANKNMSNINDSNVENSPNSRYPSSSPVVFVNEINQNEAIVQICIDGNEVKFTDLLQRVEDEGICVNSASTLYVCENRTSSHLHIQMNRVISEGEEYVAELKDKFINWMR